MDKVRAMMDSMMGEAADKSASPLAALGLGHLSGGSDLLDDMLERRQASASPAEGGRSSPERSSGFDALKDQFRHPQPEPEPESTPVPESHEPPPEPEHEAPPERKPDYEAYHNLNHEMVQTRQEMEQYREGQRQMQQWMQQQEQARQQQQRQQTPAIEEQLYQEFGMADPAALRMYTDAIVTRIRNENQQQYNTNVLPVLVQQQRDRLDLAIARQKESCPRFDKYFVPEKLKGLQEQLIQRHGVNHVAAIDWDGQLQQAYKAADYQHLKAEYEKLEKASKKGADEKDARKAEQKKELPKVPKADQQSADSSPSYLKAIDALPRGLGFKTFGRKVLDIVKARA